MTLTTKAAPTFRQKLQQLEADPQAHEWEYGFLLSIHAKKILTLLEAVEEYFGPDAKRNSGDRVVESLKELNGGERNE
jgi:hypothetical protein